MTRVLRVARERDLPCDAVTQVKRERDLLSQAPRKGGVPRGVAKRTPKGFCYTTRYGPDLGRCRECSGCSENTHTSHFREIASHANWSEGFSEGLGRSLTMCPKELSVFSALATPATQAWSLPYQRTLSNQTGVCITNAHLRHGKEYLDG
jgi:hypothetical protein